MKNDGSILEFLNKNYAFKSLELNDKGKKEKPVKSTQITFDFNDKENDKLKSEIDKIDIMNITPIDAINILAKLKNMNKN